MRGDRRSQVETWKGVSIGSFKYRDNATVTIRETVWAASADVAIIEAAIMKSYSRKFIVGKDGDFVAFIRNLHHTDTRGTPIKDFLGWRGRPFPHWHTVPMGSEMPPSAAVQKYCRHSRHGEMATGRCASKREIRALGLSRRMRRGYSNHSIRPRPGAWGWDSQPLHRRMPRRAALGHHERRARGHLSIHTPDAGCQSGEINVSGVPEAGSTKTMSLGSRRGVSTARKTTGPSRISGSAWTVPRLKNKS